MGKNIKVFIHKEKQMKLGHKYQSYISLCIYIIKPLPKLVYVVSDTAGNKMSIERHYSQYSRSCILKFFRIN